MSFSVFELGRFSGRKVALYRFAVGAVVWRFTSAQVALTLGAETFTPAPGITHTAVRETAASAQKNQLTISMPYRMNPLASDAPATQDIGNVFNPWSPSQRMLVTVLVTHLGDPDAETNVEWMGRVVAPRFEDASLELTCDPSYRNPRSAGAQRRIGRACDVPLFSQGLGMCNVEKAAHAVPATLGAVSGLTLTAAAFASAPRPLVGGMLEWTRSNGLVETRTIWSHDGDEIVINWGGPELEVGAAVTAYPNCPHNVAGCQSFDNEPNYPGWPNLPSSDPMPRSQAW